MYFSRRYITNIYELCLKGSLIFCVARRNLRFSFHRCRLCQAVLGDYSLYRGWIISLQWSAPNRLSHWFSQSPGISSGKLASSEDSHGSRQARSTDYGESFSEVSLSSNSALRKPASITAGLVLRGFSRCYYFIIRAQMRLFLLPDLSYHLISITRWPASDRFQSIVIGNFSSSLRSSEKVTRTNYFFLTSRQFPRAFN